MESKGFCLKAMTFNSLFTPEDYKPKFVAQILHFNMSKFTHSRFIRAMVCSLFVLSELLVTLFKFTRVFAFTWYRMWSHEQLCHQGRSDRGGWGGGSCPQAMAFKGALG